MCMQLFLYSTCGIFIQFIFTYIHTAPSSSPEHFQATVTGSRSIYFEWDPPPPEEQNGIVRQYTITMLEVETGEAIITVSSANSLTVSTLKPYTTYVCSIVAETIAAGPSSQILQVQTQEDGKQSSTDCLLSGAAVTMQMFQQCLYPFQCNSTRGSSIRTDGTVRNLKNTATELEAPKPRA